MNTSDTKEFPQKVEGGGFLMS